MEDASPLDEAFESAPALRALTSAILRGDDISANFLAEASQEYVSKIASGEYWHKTSTDILFRHRIEQSGPMARVYVTRAQCPVTQRYVTQRKQIGVDIPEPEYRGVLESPDFMLAEQYPPTCTPCSLGRREERTHPATMGFTQLFAAKKLPLFNSLYRTLEHAHIVEGEHIYSGLHDVPHLQEEVAAIHYELEEDAARAEQKFRESVFDSPDEIFVEARVKGHERLREKLKRHIAAAYASNSPVSQVRDVYGARFIASTRDDVERIIFDLKNEIVQLHGIDTLIPLEEYPRHKDDPYVRLVNKPTHWSLRLTVRFGPPTLRSRMSIQGMSTSDWFVDQNTHAPYEVQQNANLRLLQQRHPELRRACQTIDQLFSHFDRGNGSPGAFGTSS